VPPSLHFGRGDSAERFMRELRTAAFWRTSRQKQFRDITVERTPGRIAAVTAQEAGESGW
jgi:hypothetical protein